MLQSDLEDRIVGFVSAIAVYLSLSSLSCCVVFETLERERRGRRGERERGCCGGSENEGDWFEGVYIRF